MPPIYEILFKLFSIVEKTVIHIRQGCELPLTVSLEKLPSSTTLLLGRFRSDGMLISLIRMVIHRI